MYKIEFARKAAKFYQQVDDATAGRLNRIFEKLAEDPFNLPNVKQLKGELSGSCRIRMGDIRIIYSIDEFRKTIFIEIVGFRGSVYKK